MAAAGLLFAAMGVGIKLVSGELSNSTVVFFRNAVSVPVLLPWLLRQGPSAFHTRDLTGHAVRGIGGLVAMYCFFYAIAHLRLADAILLNQSVPLFLPLVGLLSAVIGALAQVSVRRLTRTEPAARIVFYFALTGALGALPGTWLTW